MKELFALIPINEKKQLRFRSIISITPTREKLDSEINSNYYATKGCKAKGSKFELEDYMQDKVIVKINYEIVK